MGILVSHFSDVNFVENEFRRKLRDKNEKKVEFMILLELLY